MNLAESTGPIDWIYLCTPRHTGTHFVRFLLELHPRIAYWKCGRTMIDGSNMTSWQFSCQRGRITPAELSAVIERAPCDFPDWTLAEAKRLRVQIPEKTAPRPLLHAHIDARQQFWYPGIPTIVTVRDPLLSVIGALRRGAKGAQGLIDGFRFLAELEAEACFWFPTDLWQTDRAKALTALEFLGLNPTREIEQFAARWPVLNSTSDGRFADRDRQELVDARRWAIEERRIHPAVQNWAERIRESGVQPMLERLGYRDLAWFE